jgi:hypothetical protein
MYHLLGRTVTLFAHSGKPATTGQLELTAESLRRDVSQDSHRQKRL